MSTDLDQALLSGDESLIDESLSNLELDEALLFGEEGGEDGQAFEPEQNIVAEEQNNPENQAALPEVIDTTGTVQPANGSDNQQGAEIGNQSNNAVKEIDGQLYVAVSADNAEIAAKGGKHTIPYDVLTRNRDLTKELQGKISELEQQLGQATTAQQKNEILTKQLEDAGITPDRLPDEMLNDPQAVQTIIDEIDGPAGQIIAALFNKVQSSQPQQPQQQQQQASQPAQPGNDPLDAPELGELKGWLDSDQDRWDTAVIIDKSLQRDPQFASLPVTERYAEVQRRVKASFGDPVAEGIKQELNKQDPAQAANAQQQEQQTQVPNSPGSLSGGATDTTAAAQQAMLAQDPLALEQAMENMSSSDLDALLMEASDSL